MESVSDAESCSEPLGVTVLPATRDSTVFVTRLPAPEPAPAIETDAIVPLLMVPARPRANAVIDPVVSAFSTTLPEDGTVDPVIAERTVLPTSFNATAAATLILTAATGAAPRLNANVPASAEMSESSSAFRVTGPTIPATSVLPASNASVVF